MKHIIRYQLPWILTAIFMFWAQWYWWADALVFPAVVTYNDRTYTTDINLNQTPEFNPGETILIHGYSKLLRECPRRWERSVVMPDGTRHEVGVARGVKTDAGEEGAIIIPLRTEPYWPPGEYRYESVGWAECNLVRAQRLEGFRVAFTLADQP